METRRSRAGQIWVLALTSIASFMISLDSQVVTTALNVIRIDLGASMELLEWTVNAYILSFAVLLLGGSALGDRFGRRRMLMAGLALFTAASAACGAAPNVVVLIAARAVQGVGAALIMPLAMALLSGAYSAAERGKALGIFASITGAAMIAGPVLGGAIAAGLRLAMDLLDQPADRPRAVAAGLSPYRRGVRPQSEARSARDRARDRRRLCAGLGPDARQPCRLAEPRSRHRLCSVGIRFVAFHPMGSARSAADATARTFPPSRFRDREPRQPALLRRDLRHDLPARAIPARPRRATVRSAPGCASCRGRRRCSSWRRSPAASSIASARSGWSFVGMLDASGRHGHDRADRDTGPHDAAACDPAGARRLRRLDRHAGGAECASSTPCRRAISARRRAPTTCCASSAACSASRRWWRPSRQQAAPPRRRLSPPASRPRWGSPLRCRCWAP